MSVFRNVVDTKTFPSARSDPTFSFFAVCVRLCKLHECGCFYVFTMTSNNASSLQFFSQLTNVQALATGKTTEKQWASCPTRILVRLAAYREAHTRRLYLVQRGNREQCY